MNPFIAKENKNANPIKQKHTMAIFLLVKLVTSVLFSVNFIILEIYASKVIQIHKVIALLIVSTTIKRVLGNNIKGDLK